MSKLDDRDLQRYFDGELGRRRGRRVREHLEGSEADRRRLDELGQLQGLLRIAAEEAAEEPALQSCWEQVREGIAQRPALSWRQLLRAWLRQHRFAFAGAFATVAVAVTIIAVVLNTPVGRAPSNDCVIESLEVGPKAVSTIFTINDPGHSGATTVIWVDENSGED